MGPQIAHLEDDYISQVHAASPPDIKAMLLSLCAEEDSGNARKTVAGLSRLKTARQQLTVAGTKRKAECELAICADCRNIYAPEENEDKGCHYHPGALEVDYDRSDSEEDSKCDSEDLKNDMPEFCKWDCCGKNGEDKDGCVRARHSVIKKEQMRYEQNQEYEGDDNEEDEDEEDEDGEE